MSTSYAWDDDGERTMRVTYEGDWNWEEAYPTFAAALDLIETQPHRINLIMHLHCHNWLDNLRATRDIELLIRLCARTPNINTIVVAGLGGPILIFWQMLWALMAAMNVTLPVELAPTVEEARSLLVQPPPYRSIA